MILKYVICIDMYIILSQLSNRVKGFVTFEDTL